MHDIWNPWHGCHKCSEGCAHCYMYFLDSLRGKQGSNIRLSKSGFDYPLRKKKDGSYQIQSGEMIRVCMTSDFFLEEADPWRAKAWDIIYKRSDVKFFLLTKRPERVLSCLPPDWGEGWENVFFNVTAENQARAEERIPLLLELPFKHKGVMCAPLLGPLDLSPYLKQGQIEQVIAGGENYDGARPCHFSWAQSLSKQCRQVDVTFCFIETGSVFVKGGRAYHLPSKSIQSKMACKSGVNFQGKKMEFRLFDPWGQELKEDELYKPKFRERCLECASRVICNGCSDCSKCEGK